MDCWGPGPGNRSSRNDLDRLELARQSGRLQKVSIARASTSQRILALWANAASKDFLVEKGSVEEGGLEERGLEEGGSEEGGFEEEGFEEGGT